MVPAMKEKFKIKMMRHNVTKRYIIVVVYNQYSGDHFFSRGIQK